MSNSVKSHQSFISSDFAKSLNNMMTRRKVAFFYLSYQKNLKQVKFKPHTRLILCQMRLFQKNPNVCAEGRIVAYDLSVAGVAQLLAAT